VLVMWSTGVSERPTARVPHWQLTDFHPFEGAYMYANTAILVALLVLSVVAVAWLWRKRVGSKSAANIQPQSSALMSLQGQEPFLPKAELPHAIVIGEDVSKPAVTISALAEAERYRAADVMPIDSMVAGRLGQVLQAAPSMLVSAAHHGKQLMEVTINGELARTATGDGFRAWTKNAQGQISGHATLNDTNNLQNLVNAAAVWQIASVVVAQKHLADISSKLDDIKKGIEDIKDYLEDERRAKLLGDYDYLRTAFASLRSGEFSPAVRMQIEAAERELLQVQSHLTAELMKRGRREIKHEEHFGTEDLTNNTVTKYEALLPLVQDIRLLLKVRLLNWYMLSLFPGESSLARERMKAIRESAESLGAQASGIEDAAESDARKIVSMWNTEATLQGRREKVCDRALSLVSHLTDAAKETVDGIGRTNDSLQRDVDTSVLVEFENGQLTGLRLPRMAVAA